MIGSPPLISHEWQVGSLGDNNDHHGPINHYPKSWDDLPSGYEIRSNPGRILPLCSLLPSASSFGVAFVGYLNTEPHGVFGTLGLGQPGSCVLEADRAMTASVFAGRKVSLK